MNNFQIVRQTYRFECSRCANCCSGDIRIELNLYDLYKMAVFLNLQSTLDLFKLQYVCLDLNEHQVWIPLIRFKTFPARFCPFLINEVDEQRYIQGSCSLHPDFKPLICSLSPIGRIIDFESNEDDYVFVNPAPDCPGLTSRRENVLYEVQASWQEELDFQRRYFRILQALKGKHKHRLFYLRRVYNFETDKPFSKILTHIERKIFYSGFGD